MIWENIMIFGNLILDLIFLSNVIIFCRNLMNRGCDVFSQCACMRMRVYVPWNIMSCPEGHVLLDLALCSGTYQHTSVRSSQKLPRTDMQHDVTRRQSHPGPRPAGLCASIAAQGYRGRSDCAPGSLMGWAPFCLGLLVLSFRTGCLKWHRTICLQAGSAVHKF